MPATCPTIQLFGNALGQPASTSYFGAARTSIDCTSATSAATTAKRANIGTSFECYRIISAVAVYEIDDAYKRDSLSLEPMIWLPAYAAAGAIVGFLAGLLGIGGGMTLVPVLSALFSAQQLTPDHT